MCREDCDGALDCDDLDGGDLGCDNFDGVAADGGFGWTDAAGTGVYILIDNGVGVGFEVGTCGEGAGGKVVGGGGGGGGGGRDCSGR